MADRKDILMTELALVGTGATQIGRTLSVPKVDRLTMGVVVSVTAATLQATLALTGTNDNVRAFDTSQVLPALTSGVLITAVPGTVTLAATGLLTFNNLGIGTQDVTIAFTGGFTKWIRPVWTFTSGGGTVSVQATVCAWST
jgi:hypothetical protein